MPRFILIMLGKMLSNLGYSPSLWRKEPRRGCVPLGPTQLLLGIIWSTDFWKVIPTSQNQHFKKASHEFQAKRKGVFLQVLGMVQCAYISLPTSWIRNLAHRVLLWWITLDMSQFVEMMRNGEFLNKDLDEAWEYLDSLEEIAQNWVWALKTIE